MVLGVKSLRTTALWGSSLVSLLASQAHQHHLTNFWLEARLEFARVHADKDEDYWDSILWSDETKINVFGTDGVAKVRNTEEEKCMVPTVKHGGGSVLMWGYMSAAGVGELHFIDGITNSQMYCSILK